MVVRVTVVYGVIEVMDVCDFHLACFVSRNFQKIVFNCVQLFLIILSIRRLTVKIPGKMSELFIKVKCSLLNCGSTSFKLKFIYVKYLAVF